MRRPLVCAATTLVLVEAFLGASSGVFGMDGGLWATQLREAEGLNFTGEYRRALNKYQELLSASRVRQEVEIQAYVLSQMADARIELGTYADAKANAREAVALLTRINRTHSGLFAIVQGVLATALRVEGNYSEAREAVQQAVSLGKETLNTGSPRYSILLTYLALVSLDGGELRRCVELCRRAVAVFENAPGKNQIQLGSAYANLAVAYSLRGKPRKALSALNLARTAWTQVLPTNHPFMVYALNTELQICIQRKTFREAERIAPELLRLGESRFGSHHPEFLILPNSAAALHAAEKNYSEAEPFLREGVQIARQQFPADHPTVRNMILNYSFILEMLNRKEEASLARAEGAVLLAFPTARLPKRSQYPDGLATR